MLHRQEGNVTGICGHFECFKQIKFVCIYMLPARGHVSREKSQISLYIHMNWKYRILSYAFKAAFRRAKVSRLRTGISHNK